MMSQRVPTNCRHRSIQWPISPRFTTATIRSRLGTARNKGAAAAPQAMVTRAPGLRFSK